MDKWSVSLAAASGTCKSKPLANRHLAELEIAKYDRTEHH